MSVFVTQMAEWSLFLPMLVNRQGFVEKNTP